MVILDCWKHSVFIRDKSSSDFEHHSEFVVDHPTNHTANGLIIRPPSPNCQCSCHYQRRPLVVRNGAGNGDYSTLSTTYDCHNSSHLYSSVLKSPNRFNKNLSYSTTYESTGLYSNYLVARGRGESNDVSRSNKKKESNYSDITTIVRGCAPTYGGLSHDRKQLLTQSDAATVTSYNKFILPPSYRIDSNRKNILFLVRIDPFKFAAMEPLHVDNRLIVFSLVDSFTKLSPNKILENYVKKLQEEGKTSINIFNLSEPLQYLKNSITFPICEYGWPEKRAPSLEKLCSICKAIDSWLSLDQSNNIAIIYSKRDLSRASLAIAVFLHYIQICLGTDTFFDFESMYNYFHFNLESYLQPSQKRYIDYFKSLLNGDSRINNQKFYLNQMIIKKIPNFGGNGLCKPFIKVYQGLNLVYSSQIINITREFADSWDLIVFDIKPPLKLRGDILIKCYHKIISPSSRTEMFSFQFHTGTLTNNIQVFNKNEIDIALYDKRFHNDTRVELLFNDVHCETIQSAEFIEDNQITKCNSYENFFSDIPSLEYTKGPLDGSLYATVLKKNVSSPVDHDHSTPIDQPNTECVLDELINEIFSEIRSFPDTSDVSKQKYLKNNGTSIQQYDYLDFGNTLKNDGRKSGPKQEKENIYPVVFSDQQSVLSDNCSETENWLQKQQRKLKLRQYKADLVEKRLIDELKNTIGGNKLKNGLQVPEVPPRKSSRNFLPVDSSQADPEYIFDTLSSLGNGTVYSLLEAPNHNIRSDDNESFDHSSANNTSEPKSLIRSSTPAFPVGGSKTLKQIEESNGQTSNGPLFIKDTSAYWYKPNISREDAVKYLSDKPPGSFLIRDSNSFPNAYGLAVKVPPQSISNTEPVRHFLIESTNKGVQIKGCPEEPVFSSLAALVYQHSITRISLPVVLIIPSSDIDNSSNSYLKRFYDNGAACNVLYYLTKDVESLTGPMTIKKVIDDMFENFKKVKPAVVNFKASIKGITLTDNSHKLFFRQHYPLKSISYCSMDPENRFWLYKSEQLHMKSHLFAFVARKKNSNQQENICLIFGQFEPDQPSHAIVDFVNKLLES